MKRYPECPPKSGQTLSLLGNVAIGGTSRKTHDAANLDLLRAVAVSFVLIAHLLPALGAQERAGYHLQALGLLGVAIFFVHTSLVLMFSLERQLATSSGDSAYSTFVIRRIFRIYPLSIVTVMVTVALSLRGLGPFLDPTAKRVISNLLLVQNLTGQESVSPVLWSLPYEMQMYLVLPFLFLLARQQTRASTARMLALWALSVLTVIAVWRLKQDITLIKYIPCFIPGILAYTRWKNTGARLPSAVLAVSLGILGALIPALVSAGLPENFLNMFVCLALGLLLPSITEISNRAVRESSKVIAKYSYGIYLVHTPLIWLAFERSPRVPLTVGWATFILGMIALPFAAFHLIERPMINVGIALAGRLNRAASKPSRADFRS
jgi:peptidoglycan/LPS O-acetylase OafA/YrhL